MNIFQRWKQTALHNKALVVTSVLVAFGTLFYAGAAVVQIWILTKSAEASSRQTEQLIEQAKKNAGAAERFAASAESVNRETEKAVREFQRMAKASERNLATTKSSPDWIKGLG